jgi:tetratricopeptide (TPR) repeat protein
MAVALAAHLAIAPSLARGDGASAADLKARGDAAMDEGAFASAILKYRSSYELSPNPALLYNIGNAYERLGDYPHALVYLERFAGAAPPELRARVPRLDELLDSVRARIARLHVRCSVPGARVLVRGGSQGTTPLEKDIVAMPGDAHVEVVAEGYRSFVQEVELTAGKSAYVDAVLVPDLAMRSMLPAHAEKGSPPITTTWWFWTGVGVVVAGGAVAVAVALSRSSSAAKSDGPPGQAAAPLVSW